MRVLIIFLFSLLLLIFVNNSFGCDKKIVDNNIILFVDLNGGTQEIEKAREAACKRGQELLVYPIQSSVEVSKTVQEKAYFGNQRKALKDCDTKRSNAKECDAVEKKIMDNENKMTEFDKSGLLKKASLEELNSLLKNIKTKEGKSVETLILSGHSGGKEIWGSYGKLELLDIQKSFQALPDKGGTLNSLILLACYSNNPGTIVKWKEYLPSIKLIAGSDAMASGSENKFGLNYLANLLINTKSIISSAEKKTLELRLKKLVPTLNKINSSLYINTSECGKSEKDSQYLYKSVGGLASFNPDDCKKSIIEYRAKIEVNIDDYFNGPLEIPFETSGTPLRELYTFMRQNEHCLELEKVRYTADQLYGLLFFHNIKLNILMAYQKKFEEVNQVINNKNELYERIKTISPPSRTLDFVVAKTTINPLASKSVSKEDIDKLWPFTPENIKSKSRSEILSNIKTLQGLKDLASDDQSLKIKNLKNNLISIQKTLVDLDCYDPTWHDVKVNPLAVECLK